MFSHFQNFKNYKFSSHSKTNKYYAHFSRNFRYFPGKQNEKKPNLLHQNSSLIHETWREPRLESSIWIRQNGLVPHILGEFPEDFSAVLRFCMTWNSSFLSKLAYTWKFHVLYFFNTKQLTWKHLTSSNECTFYLKLSIYKLVSVKS